MGKKKRGMESNGKEDTERGEDYAIAKFPRHLAK